MRVVFTGASSFSGMHFVEALARAGHDVTCTFTLPSHENYAGMSFVRVGHVLKWKNVRPVYGTAFGAPGFFKLIEEGADAICHHGCLGSSAGHTSKSFSPLGATSTNAMNAQEVLKLASRAGVKQFIYTGTYSERLGPDPEQRAFNAYSLSKTLTSDVLEFHCREAGVRFRKFTMPNPFGPLENARFTTTAVGTWMQGKIMHVRAPQYVRDNCHVGLLARAYAKFVGDPIRDRLDASGYAMSQGMFAHLFADEMRKRLDLECRVEWDKQESFPEPRTRFNPHRADLYVGGWDERQAWNDLARYYRDELGAPAR